MTNDTQQVTICLVHQLPEDQTSYLGLVCPHCKHRLYALPPQGRLGCFWESQPMAYTLDRKPCFVYSLMWDDFRIRSLHAADSEVDTRAQHRSEESPEETISEAADETTEQSNDPWFDGPRF